MKTKSSGKSPVQSAYVIISESHGVLSEHQRREQAEIAMIAYLRSVKPIEAELTAVYRRSEDGMVRL